MIKNKFVLIRYVLMLWMLCGASYTLSIASAYDRNASSQGWGYQPLSTMNGSNYHATTAPARSDFPVLRFRSTSAYADKFDMQSRPLMMGGDVVLMGNPWTDDQDPTEPGMGELEPDMPVGDVPWLFLLLLAVGYTVCRRVLLRRLF